MKLLTIVFALSGTLMQAGSARSGIGEANKTLATGVAQGRLEIIMSVYSAAPEMVSPDGKPATGREAVTALWKSYLDRGTNSLELKTTDVDVNDTTVDERGNYTVKRKDGSIDRGQYQSVWIREKGSWKLQRVVWK